MPGNGFDRSEFGRAVAAVCLISSIVPSIFTKTASGSTITPLP
jgi:hypothetical protein